MMSLKNIILVKTAVLVVLQLKILLCSAEEVKNMSRQERLELRDEARDMFYHAYNAYMENAYPADELMPLSCKGRYRGLTPNRGDIDDALGNFSLTLIDSLDTLVVLGDMEEFENAVKLVLKDVNFDNDVVVSVFETNIRVVGGLISAHILADLLQQRDGLMPWYKGELLNMAKDVGYRLLPAFNTTTGIPYSRVNMRYGIKSDKIEHFRETCTACAGSMILEMAALSRLTGEPIFEEKAHKAMDELWKMRHRSSDLMGTVLNVHSGDWVRRDSGVGAGIDSYYEYCLKAYILLGDDKYLHRFNRHYSAIMKYISQGPMLVDVHMHRPHTASRNFMDALLAFWPGLQVLKGDIKPAVETHEMLYQVMQRHTFIPEAFTTDFQVHWGNHPLRPEFLESTYFLYSATGDKYYLDVGKNVLKTLQKYARVPCGYAAVNDVRTGNKEDRMDSFVLAETFKYLYLLFADKEDIPLKLDEFIFTTEGHLFPLALSGHGPNSSRTLSDIDIEESELSNICPNTFTLFPHAVRKPLKHMVDGMCPRRTGKRRLRAEEFAASNINHLMTLKEMGISLIAMKDGRVQLLHNPATARSKADSDEGLLFMTELAEISKVQEQQPDVAPQVVSFPLKDDVSGNTEMISVQVGPAQFGKILRGNSVIKAGAVRFSPLNACSELEDSQRAILAKGLIAIIERGDCMFIDKVRRAQKYGAVAAIVIDNVIDSSLDNSPMFSMSGDGSDDVKIPAVFMFSQDAQKLLKALDNNPFIEVTLKEMKNAMDNQESVFQRLKVSVQDFINRHTGMSFDKAVVEDSGFKAYLDSEVLRVELEQHSVSAQPIFQDKEIDPHWGAIRRDLLKSLLQSKTKELYIPLSTLTVYYKTLSGDAIYENDYAEQSRWLVQELAKELYGEKQKGSSRDDALVKPNIWTDLEQLTDDLGKMKVEGEDSEDLKQRRSKQIEKISDIINNLRKMERLEQDGLLKVLSKIQKEGGLSDDIITASSGTVKEETGESTSTIEIRNPDEL
ncbi:ER degradation-enhancing alpha-mannosidase-like protein 3 [Anthonomus grandis grandis]|uniref:ER degradation-enhancing alpha-mannosidase-like protein 3 n=1 Tax=Anthonomus grandis grandis TaxID=2921223 RepID=UPI0021653A53|nr:ER degradation-enhancing alpha-mannosidase-like protein 3 [Anthonomus grandis grandis]XP_050308917.1 ER degradation-enhancing alpha-mannosidase-like protein 3 [Anthonomus grandis grandis]